MGRRPTATDLGKLPLFGGLPEDALRTFADQAELRSVDAGAFVFREDEAAKHLYVLEAGALDVVKRTDGDEILLYRVRPGESFGEMSFIDVQPRSASVRATAASELWVWPYTCIHERYCKDAKCHLLLVMNLARELSRRLRRADDMIASGRTSPPARV